MNGKGMKRHQSGFGFTKPVNALSLIEILVTISILAILIGIFANLNSEAPRRWRVRKAIQELHHLKKSMETYWGMCGGPVYSTNTASTTAFRDLLCNNSTSIRVWPAYHCGGGTGAPVLPGLQTFMDVKVVNDTSGCASASWIEGNTVDQIFNADDSAAMNCSASNLCPPGNIYCPWQPGQGFLVSTLRGAPAAGAAISQANKAARTNPPTTVFCGSIVLNSSYSVLVLMDQTGTGTKYIPNGLASGAPGVAIPNACATGQWCMEVKSGVTQTGCCSTLGYGN